MSRLVRRIRRPRDTPPASIATPVESGPGAAERGLAPTGSAADPRDPGAVHPPRLPAGTAPEDLIGAPPDTRRRGRLRRRLRHLRQVRELMLRDAGGLVYELHRTGARLEAGGPHSLVAGKLDRLAALDAERRELEEILGDRRRATVLREPGVGGTCPSCHEYFPSDARFCAHCGQRVDGPTPAAPDPSGPAAADGRAEEQVGGLPGAHEGHAARAGEAARADATEVPT